MFTLCSLIVYADSEFEVNYGGDDQFVIHSFGDDQFSIFGLFIDNLVKGVNFYYFLMAIGIFAMIILL